MRAFVLGNHMNVHFLCVDRLSLAGESLADHAPLEHGGKGLNLAVGLHRLGVALGLLMVAGTNEAGAVVKPIPSAASSGVA